MPLRHGLVAHERFGLTGFAAGEASEPWHLG
jgi:hypothetical protein